MYKYEPELSTNIEISRQNKKIIFSVLTKKRCVKNRSPEQLRTIKEFFPTIEVCVFLNNLQDKLCAIYKYNNEINTLDAHEYLLNRLPEYMIPQSFIRVTTFPITINGKIDRKKLMELLDSERNKSDLVKKHVTEVCGEEFIGRNTK